ncbi:FlgD Ig-like domain-containing protein [Nocardioides alpinus]|uniref:FlgD Ig-like domain-containing protein n=1 Tax=Nocardioides alpinus TaxID=748909 RepID=A0A1I0YAK6_9ACTN|nr:FlgD immunoglobulin-like domain containing protein [Nocardioides alpinus]PKH38940.1 hypothetical protein CXG46_14475 [Nocardioides alpinus]SFB10324.1 FlgD Ig-like domain-containing protein [Nocardioides alpinus]
MTTRRAGLVGAVALVVSTLAVSTYGVAGAGASPVQAQVRADRDLLGQVSSSRWFSPNNDRSKDVVEVGIRLETRAAVSITVRHERKGWVARRVSLGSEKAGKRVWTWNGRNDDGRAVIDGNYVDEVVAVGARGRDRATTRIKSRRTYSSAAVDSPVLTVDRTTVASGGTVRFTARQGLEARNAFGRDRSRPVLTAVTVYADSGGAAVAAAFPSVLEFSDPVRSWTPTTPGTYSVVAHFVDSYGTSGTAARRVTVTP